MIDQILKSGKFPPILLLFGEEDLLVEEDAQRLYDAASAQDTTGMNCDVLDGEEMSLDAVLSIARSFPMMSERRVVWVRRADKLTASKGKKGTDPMQSYLDAPSTSTFLLLTASLVPAHGITAALTKSAIAAKRKVAALKYPFNLLLNNAPYGEYPHMREAQVGVWLEKRAKSLGITLPRGATELLVAKTGTSLRDLAMEMEKLSSYLGSRLEATPDDIQAIAGSSREFNVFELQKAIGKANTSQATTILTRMMETDRQEMLILAMLTRYMTSLFRLIDLRGVSDRAEIARIAGIKPFAIGEYFDALDHLGPARIERALSVLRSTEATLKSTSTDAMTVLQLMVARILD
ncbi:MAG: DNA polymerase III subunit delta [Candidatus Kapabacteria bacterium]|nr:DNA polymerase III subunit delta [Candidatus Kapabacteria bacterium]